MNKFNQIAAFLADHHQPRYRLTQITAAIFSQNIVDFEKMVFLPKELRQDLAKEFSPLLSIAPGRRVGSGDGEKILFSLSDNEKIETVKMVYRDWQSLCLSSQVGCPMNCAFCATGKAGFARQLTTDEIIDQLLYFRLQGEKIDTVSFMGMGEPLANSATFEAIEVITNPQLFNISLRKINVSTIGILPALKRLIDTFPSINVAYSLNSPFPAQRQELMPIEKKFPFRKILPVLNYHIRQNRRKVFVGYVLLAGVNDSPGHARALAALISSQKEAAYLYHVNLIAYHPVGGLKFKSPSRVQITGFANQLKRLGIETTIRRSVGLSFQGACGQLRGNYVKIG